MSRELDSLKSVFLQLKEATTPQEAFKIIFRNHFNTLLEAEHDKAKQEFILKYGYNPNFNRYKNITCYYCYNYGAATEDDKKTIIRNFKRFNAEDILLLKNCYYYFIFKDNNENIKETLPKRL